MPEASQFVADPSSRFLGIFEISREVFDKLPDHPAQRQTVLHAVNLVSCGVLNQPIDQHREVAVLLTGEAATGRTIGAMQAALSANMLDAIQRFGCKLNGHTRSYIWTKGLCPVPEMLRVSVYAAADRPASVQVYNAVDSLVSVKSKKDITQSTLNVAGIHPSSEILQRATVVGPALDLATGIQFGSLDYRARHLPLSATDISQDAELHALLPYLAAVRRFKSAIIALDNLNPIAKAMPTRPPFIAAYVAILDRDLENGMKFLTRLQQEAGEYSGGLMDAFYAVKKVGDWLNEKKRSARSSPAQRTQQTVSCVLNAYEGWTLSQDEFKADAYPLRTQVIQRFNPTLKTQADEMEQEYAARRVAAREAQLAARAERRGQRIGISSVSLGL